MRPYKNPIFSSPERCTKTAGISSLMFFSLVRSVPDFRPLVTVGQDSAQSCLKRFRKADLQRLLEILATLDGALEHCLFGVLNGGQDIFSDLLNQFVPPEGIAHVVVDDADMLKIKRNIFFSRGD